MVICRLLPAACCLLLFIDATAEAAEMPGPTPADKALATMIARPGFEVELMAAEPLVEDPVSFAWGPDGKLWVVEMSDYPLGIDGHGKFGGKVRYLEDTDGDGRYDRSTIFLDELGFPNGVMPWSNGVLVSAAPEIFYAEDTNGDGRADVRRTLYQGFTEGNQQHRVNGFRWGLDNWIHCGNGDSGGAIESKLTGAKINLGSRDFRIRPDTGELEPQSGITQFSRVSDDWGNWFGTKNSQPLLHYVLADEYLRRNPHLPAIQSWVEVPSVPGAAPIYPRSAPVVRFNDLNKANRFTSACGEAIYRDELFGPEFAGNSFVCEPVHNLVHREVLTQSGVKFTSHRVADELKSEFLASTDNWSRPVMVRNGPDGALWVADMYRLVIEHPEWIPKQWQERIDVRAGHDKGRIYRVFPRGKPPRAIPRIDKLDSAALASMLDHPSGTVRDLVQQRIVERQMLGAIDPLRQLVAKASRPQTRLQALCSLDGLKAVDKETLSIALADIHPGVRRHALRLAEPWLDKDSELATKVEFLVSDGDPMVRLQAAYSLGAWHDPRAGRALGRLALASGQDLFTTTAALSSLNSDNLAAVVQTVLDVKAEPGPPADLVERLVAQTIAFKHDGAFSHALEVIGRDTDGNYFPWQRAALRGLLDSLSRRGQSLAKLRADASPAIAMAIDRLQPMFVDARRLCIDEQASLANRVAATKLLARGLGDHQLDIQLLTGLLAPQTPRQLQSAAIAGLSGLSDARSPQLLLSAWKSMSPASRGDVLDALLGRTAWSSALLDGIERGEIAAAEIDAARAQRLLDTKDESLRTRSAKLLGGSSNPDRQKVVAQYRESTQLTGDSARGAEVFKKRCSTCHKLGTVGHAIGPDLTALTDKSPQSLLVAILDPNKAVETKFISYTAVTADGLTHTGMLAAETDSSVTLLAAESKEIPLLRSDLETLASTSKSLMPEGLEKDLQPQDLADLFVLVAQSATPRKTFARNFPEVVQPEDLRGEFYLLPENAEIYGNTLVVEDRYDNLGFWQSANDYAAWIMNVPKAGAFDVWLEYACANDDAGNEYTLFAGPSKKSGRVSGTGSWDSYRPMSVGRVELDAGQQRVLVKPAGKLHGALFDLKSIRLKPVAK